jgi:hypothetical protein
MVQEDFERLHNFLLERTACQKCLPMCETWSRRSGPELCISCRRRIAVRLTRR